MHTANLERGLTLSSSWSFSTEMPTKPASFSLLGACPCLLLNDVSMLVILDMSS